MSSYKEGMIFGMCNPLLDLTADCDEEFLKKFNLEPNAAILGDDSNFHLYKEMEDNYPIDYTLGGATQNTMRVISAITKCPNIATYMGCVGKDDYSDKMKEKAKEVGVNVCYQYNDKVHTGRCAVLISGKNRSLVAHLGAANHFTISHLENADNWALVEKAHVHYISGFFLTVCVEAILKVAKFSHENNRIFSTNLSATFLSQFFKDQCLKVMPYVNILFGNDDEAMAFSKNVWGIETDDIASIAKKISHLESLSDKKRIVIITRGPNPVILAIGDDVKEIPVAKLDNDKVIDTNGAGDAFVGGFFSQYLKGESIENSIKCGVWISEIVIQRSGCTFPNDIEYSSK